MSGSKPIIDGEDVVPGPTPCNAGCWSGMVQIDFQNYIDFENISVMNVEGYGIKVRDCENINIYNIKTENTYRNGIQLKDCNKNGGSSVIEGCDIREYARVWPEYCESNPDCGWPAGLVGLGTHNLIIRKNIVYEGYGEGIYFGNLNAGAVGSNCLIEDNIVYDSRAASIYIHNAGDVVIRRNLAYGTGNPTYCDRFVYDGVYFTGNGIYVTDEKWWNAVFQLDNIRVYNNLVAFTYSGMHIGNSHIRDDGTYASFSNSVVYNNVFVDNYNSLNIAGPFASNSFIKNNIFWCISGNCNIYNGRNSFSGIEFSNNLWSSMPPDGIQGPNDIYSLPQLTKTSGWRSMTAGSLSGHDFTLQSTSPAIDAGISTAPTVTDDYWGTSRPQGSAYDIGAYEYGGSSPSPTCASQGHNCCNSCQSGIEDHPSLSGTCP
ncbi:MAG: choice-of-anchor Q domain-containing protein, partial [Euryarchaeota archaeon]|nr:choice-of-anchor Q domain-containing protein [Euryarchaeota archaeon]